MFMHPVAFVQVLKPPQALLTVECAPHLGLEGRTHTPKTSSAMVTPPLTGGLLQPDKPLLTLNPDITFTRSFLGPRPLPR